MPIQGIRQWYAFVLCMWHWNVFIRHVAQVCPYKVCNTEMPYKVCVTGLPLLGMYVGGQVLTYLRLAPP